MAAGWLDRFVFHSVSSPSALDGRFTLVEHPQHGKRGLTVRPVDKADRTMVWKRGGFLFATEAEAWAFAELEMQSVEPGRTRVRQSFSHKRVDGLRLYIRLGNVGGASG